MYSKIDAWSQGFRSESLLEDSGNSWQGLLCLEGTIEINGGKILREIETNIYKNGS